MYAIFGIFFRLIPKTNYCRKNIFQGVLVPLYQENEKLGQSDKRGRNYPGDNDPKKVTKLNMKYGLVLNTAIVLWFGSEQAAPVFSCQNLWKLKIQFQKKQTDSQWAT